MTSNIDPRSAIRPLEREILIPMALEALSKSGLLEELQNGDLKPTPESKSRKSPKKKKQG